MLVGAVELPGQAPVTLIAKEVNMKHGWISVMVSMAVALGVWAFWPISHVNAVTANEMTIERFVYDGRIANNEGDEYVKICNISGSTIALGGTNPWRIGDEESYAGGTEGMYNLQGTLDAGACLIIASNANAFHSIWGVLPDFEMNPTWSPWTDNTTVPNLTKISSGNWRLVNDMDNITLWKYNSGSGTYEQHDEVAYGTTAELYTEVGLSDTGTYQITCGSNANCALTRNSVSVDTGNMANDFNNTDNPTAITLRALTAHNGDLSIVLSLAALALVIVAGLSLVAFRRRMS